jgi:DNA-binding MarR family transcriptional regulator
MKNDTIDLMEQFLQFEVLLHRYHTNQFKNFGPLGNPHRGQGRVLSILKIKNEISQKELGYLLDMRNTSLGELLNKLEQNGYIERSPSTEDRRTSVIRLTPEGKKTADKIDDATNEREQLNLDKVFNCLNKKEQSNLNSYLERISTELKRQLVEQGIDDPAFEARIRERLEKFHLGFFPTD